MEKKEFSFNDVDFANKEVLITYWLTYFLGAGSGVLFGYAMWGG